MSKKFKKKNRVFKTQVRKLNDKEIVVCEDIENESETFSTTHYCDEEEKHKRDRIKQL